MLRRLVGSSLLKSLTRPCTSNAAITGAQLESKINQEISENKTGRVFAVVFLNSMQYKVTAEDIVVLNHPQPVDIGDKIVLDKVLMAGTEKFSIFGRPVLPKNLVKVTGTVIEKTLSFAEPNFFFVRRKDIRLLTFNRHPLTMVRINEVSLSPNVGEGDSTVAKINQYTPPSVDYRRRRRRTSR